jgi:general secretion pathway protein H
MSRTISLRSRTVRLNAGMTVLELLIVLALMGLFAYVAWSGFRTLTSAALVEDTNDLVAVMRRTQALAVESGLPVRVVFDLDKEAYWVEACAGEPTLRRSKEEAKLDPEEQREALEEARAKIALLPAGQLKAGSAEEEARMALALAGDKNLGRSCVPVAQSEEFKDLLTGDAMGRGLARKLQTDRSVKLREIWVQHLDDSATEGQVSVNFFPLGWAEKAIIELGDGSSVHTVLLHGATGRVEVLDGPLRDPDDHMLRRADGERDKEREEAR